MHAEEVGLLEGLLSQASTFLEFGCGGSTLIAIQSQVQRLTSVESDAEWINQLRNHAIVGDAEASGRLNFCHVEIGKTGKWGHPVDRSLRHSWPKYAAEVWSKIEYTPDLILIDGRFRAACVAQSLMNTAPQCKIAIHDVDGNRPSYLEAIQLLDVIAAARTLVVGQRKPDVSNEKIQAFFKQEAMNPS